MTATGNAPGSNGAGNDLAEPAEFWDCTNPATGERMLYPLEIEQARTREEYARKAAEAEVDRLRREIERLRGDG